jgi:phosphatidylserine decarboxylase
MSELPIQDSPSPPVKWRWPGVHPEGRKFALISGGLWLLFVVLGWSILSWLMVGLTI